MDKNNIQFNKLILKTGNAFAETPEGNPLQYKMAFTKVLKEIETQQEKPKNKASSLKYEYFKRLFPQHFHHPLILSLINKAEFSALDDQETRANKYVHLSLLIRDMNDYDYDYAKELRHELPANKLSSIHTSMLVTECLSMAINCFIQIEKNIPIERQIDFELSLAQYELFRLRKSLQSPIHKSIDFSINDNMVVLQGQSQEAITNILKRLENVQSLVLEKDSILPTIYIKDLAEQVNNLSIDDKYALTKMHQEERDELRLNTNEDIFEELNQARGLVKNDDNPLDYFTPQKIRQIQALGRQAAVPEDRLHRFVQIVMKNYVSQKIPDPAHYFHQDFLQHYLEKSGKVSHETLQKIILDRIDALKSATLALRSN